ncbi:MAG TPA: hypothetical protein VGS15_07520 [Candidatus Acidoferrales bacterium]|nr:hypothetical protein [Candidatus Acidoferrales bacterium]
MKSRLGRLKLAPQVGEEVFAELSDHLEDAYKFHLAAGIDSEDAEMRALREIPAGRELARKIQRAKRGDEQMNNRIRQFWLPALVTSLIGTGLLAFMIEALRLTPRVLPVSSESSMTIYLPWLLALPFLGFLGAAMSRRAGGAIPTRILAAIFLSLIYFALPWLFVPVAMLVDHNTPRMTQVGWFFLNWAILPGLALLLGALPATFIGRERKQQILA